MAEFDYLQRILGTDKKNQIFSVFEHSLTKDYHVYYGAELFEIVPSDREDTRFKLMVAHMANIGIALAKLQATFKLDPRTIKKWSRALRSGNAEVLARAFAGRNASRKLTRAVEEYVRIRFPSIYNEDRYTYSSKIRRELKKALRVELSAEALRPLFNKLKAEFEQSEGEAWAHAQEGDQDKDGDEDEDEMEDGEPPAPGRSGDSEPEAQYPLEEAGSGSRSSIERTTCSGSEILKAPQISAEPLRALNEEDRSVPNNRKAHADFSTARWCSHLGLLLFSEPLSALEDVLGPDKGPPVIQWASQVLLGAANLEQTKLLSAADLSLLLGGEPAGTPGHQRKKLAALAEDPALARDILRWNFQRVGGPTMSDFYFDPHTKHYTGKKNVLKGWCSKIRWADKVLQGDFIHSTSGQSLYLENTDSYEDMRQRFMQIEERFRACTDIGQERVLTWVVDRGIYSSKIFAWFQQRAQRIARLESLASLGPAQRTELGRMRGAQSSALKHRKQRDQQMSSIEQEIARLDGQLAVTAKTVSRLDTLIQRGSVRLCGERKYLMDVIKITARNLFYEMLAPFKEAYDNFRDDHVWFRHLSHSGGVIVPAGPELLRSHLIGTADFPKPVRAVIREVLTKFNEIRPRLPDGSQRSIELVLGSKAAIQLAPTVG